MEKYMMPQRILELGQKLAMMTVNAVLMKAPKGKLVAQRSPSLKVMERIKPISIRKVDSNRYIVDMGRNMAGIEQVKLTGKKGYPIKMRFSEVLKTDDDSQLYVDNLRTALVEDVYPKFRQHF